MLFIDGVRVVVRGRGFTFVARKVDTGMVVTRDIFTRMLSIVVTLSFDVVSEV